MNSNFLFLSQKQIDAPVYRIFPDNRFFELFDTQTNVLVHPSKWDDPFENFVLKATVRIASGEVGSFGFRDDLFGQCWTFQSASDAMWRIYSSNKLGVRVRSTPRKLLASLSAGLGNWAPTQAFIGKVRYLPDAKMRQFARKVFSDGLNPTSIVSTLLVKRPAFEHEREVRLVYFNQERSEDRIYSYPVDAHQLIDQVMTDPRLTADETYVLHEQIKAQTGFRGDILRSMLYAPPRGFEVLIP